MQSDNYRQINDRQALAQLKEIATAVMYAAEGGTTEQVLQRIAQAARDLVKVRYAALGVPDGKGGLRYFKVAGITEEEIRHIGHLPVGRGLLGAIMHERETLRLPHMREDPRSVGFPAGHPRMDSLLGVPIQAGPQLLGMLYLCDREDGEPFDDEDQWLVETLAGYAAIAIAGAQLSEQQGLVRALEERERIGMELHDGVIQSLYAIGMHLELMRVSGDIKVEDIQHAIGNLNQVIEDIRRYILNLQSSRKSTMYSSFQDILHRLYIPSALQLKLDIPDEPAPLTPAVFDSVCQIANEALSNAVRHADASRITVTTQRDHQRLQIVIADNGKGFDVDAPGNPAGLGLKNMNQRARLSGSKVSIDSTPGEGTIVTITTPVPSF